MRNFFLVLTILVVVAVVLHWESPAQDPRPQMNAEVKQLEIEGMKYLILVQNGEVIGFTLKGNSNNAEPAAMLTNPGDVREIK